MLEELPVLYAVTADREGGPVIESCNQWFVERLGYDREWLVDRPLADVYTPDSAAALRDGGYEAALAGDCEATSRDLVRADGTVVETLVRAVPRTEDGSVAGTYSLYVDVTTRERRRRQAEVLGRLLRHNLRNDLTVVYNQAAVAVDELDDEAAAPVEQILDVADRWERLIEKAQRMRDVLSPAPDWEPTDLGTVLEGVETDLNARYPDATVRVLRPSEGAATIRPEVEHALLELCENALNHAETAAPEVVVTVSTDGDRWVEVTVADDSPAIPEAELVPLRDDETSPLIHGTGLGLWVVRLAVDRVGGQVSVLENDDDGTTVRLRYPRGRR